MQHYYCRCTLNRLILILLGRCQQHRGNRFIINLVDYFSKWPEAEAIPNTSAESVAHFLYKMMYL